MEMLSDLSTRANYRLVLHVRDAGGLEGTDAIFLSPEGWRSALRNSPPVPRLEVRGLQPIETAQPIIFDATDTYDPDMDHIFFLWTFGDGTEAEGIQVTHFYSVNGTFNVTLTAT